MRLLRCLLPTVTLLLTVTLLTACGPAAVFSDAAEFADAAPTIDARPLGPLQCSVVAQDILIIDFRSGWWAGGGGAVFHDVSLPALTSACSNISVEYLHFEIDFLQKCRAVSGQTPVCAFTSIPDSQNMTYQQVLAFFDKPHWDDYTQLWILSGSRQDPSDIHITSDFWGHFIAESRSSCIPLFVGAGDGFIDHGNVLAQELGIGDLLTTEFVEPGFFSVSSIDSPEAIVPVVVNSYMQAGQQLLNHPLLANIQRLADKVSVVRPEFPQSTHGDAIIATTESYYDIIAYDVDGRPAIAVGQIPTANPEEPRPLVIDAGFQRFYALADDPGAQTLLHNVVKYLSSVGCRAIVE